jgi:hypothetical protein
MDWQNQLIFVYLTACEYFSQRPTSEILRISPNSNPIFTDEEAITAYIFGIISSKRNVKQIHYFLKSHLKEWFPFLPKYEAFNYRITFLEKEFQGFCQYFIQKLNAKGCHPEKIVVVDSMPIMLSKGFRSVNGKVAKEVSSQSYCASKDEYYWGVKFHLFADYAEGTLPIPRLLSITEAKTHDLRAVKEFFTEFENHKILGDKAYASKPIKKFLTSKNIEIHTPVKRSKKKKELTEDEKVYSKVVSSFRQSIEIFFGWIIEKTGIQNASKTRSKKGLFVHIFGRFAAALVAFHLNF